MIWSSRNYQLIFIMISISLLVGCVELPTNNNSVPETPLLKCPPGIFSPMLPCTLTVTGSDPDGDMLAFQFSIEFQYEWGSETSEWTDYYPSGEPVDFLLFGYEGTYSVSVRSRDAMNGISGYSNVLIVTFGNSLQLLGSCGINGGARKVVADGNYAYLSTGGSGLVVVDISTPDAPQVVGQNGGYSSDCIGRNDQAIFLLSDNTFHETLYAYDVSIPESPIVFNQAEIFDGLHLDVEGNYAFVSTGWFEQTIVFIDVTDPHNFSILSTLEVGLTLDIVLRYPYAYLMSGTGNNFEVVNCSNLNAPYVVGMLDIQSSGPIYAVSNNYVYVATSNSLKVIDVTQSYFPHIVQEVEVGGFCYDLHCNGNYLAIAQDYIGLRLFDITDPVAPAIIGEYNTSGSCTGIFCGNNYLLAADGSGGLLIFHYSSLNYKLSPSQKGHGLRLIPAGLHSKSNIVEEK